METQRTVYVVRGYTLGGDSWGFCTEGDIPEVDENVYETRSEAIRMAHKLGFEVLNHG